MRFGKIITLPILMACLLVPVSKSRSHPHVWVEAETSMVFAEGRLTQLKLQWTFDPFFSAILYEDFDVNRNDHFDPTEVTAMRDGAFQGLGQVGFFTDLRVDGQRIEWNGPRDFGISVSEDDYIVSYYFTLDVPPAPNALDQSISLSLYDPEFFVDVFFPPEQPIRIMGLEAVECRYELVEAEDNPIYFGAVFPIRAEFNCSELSG